ncbi:MAG: GHKL domain-containing protein [Epsilonproteobacteria bacterium]|nr:GHKL domain-containing protein [Campylobacterota bacterium]
MNETERATLLEQLENLIAQTYNVEKEYIALRGAYDRLQSLIGEIIEALPNALWVLNEDGSVFLQNSETRGLEELLKQLPPDGDETEINLKGRHYLVKSRKRDGKRIISATDITEQKRKERLASMGQMAAHLAHEIRNPIGSITLLLSTLAKRVTPQNRPIVDEIRSALFRVERIIKSTLLYSKGVEPRIRPFTLESLEAECLRAVENYRYTKPIRFTFDFDTATITADPDLLAMVLQNLLYNAIDAIEEDEEDEGSVTLRARQEAGKTIFQIEDSGIPFTDPDQLFEAFHTTKTKGHGLGLALTRQIIEAHRGEITVKREPKLIRFIIPSDT